MAKRQKVQVECLTERPAGAHPPLVAYFSSANPKEGQYEKSSFSMYEKGRRQMIVAQKRLTMLRYAVGVFNRDAGTLQLVPISADSICRMEPRLAGLQYLPTGTSEQDATQEDDARAIRIADSKRLAENFGSTRRKRQLAQREEAVVKGSRLAASAAITHVLNIAATAATTQGITREKVMAEAASMRAIPPHNPEATTAQEAYDWRQVCPQEIRSSLVIGPLLEAAELSDNGALRLQQLQQAGAIPEYVLSRLPLIRPESGGVSEDTKEHGRKLSFLSNLMRLLAARPTIRADPQEGLRRVARDVGIREAALPHLLRMFYEAGSDGRGDVYERPDGKRELLISYLLLVALMVERFTLAAQQFEALRAQLKMTAKELVPRFKELGCTVVDEIMSVEEEDVSALTGKSLTRIRSYCIKLLPADRQSTPAKMLKDCFPKLKITRAPRK